jgi:tRNA pseudouridine13 synthase
VRVTIRRTPEDFRVNEVLTASVAKEITPDRSSTHTHAIYRVTKTSLTTPEAASRLAGALKVKSSAIEYAGLKDKHAVTTQHFSASIARDGIAANAAANVTAGGMSAERLGWLATPLDSSAIEHNEFEIVVRDLTPERSRRMTRHAEMLAIPDDMGPHESLVFINYFGDQRFGGARHGQGFAAKSLALGDFESALRLTIGTPARKDTGAKRTFTRELASRWGSWKSLARDLPACPERAAIETLAKGEGFDAAFASLPHFIQQMCVEAYQSFLWNRIASEFIATLAEPDQIFEADDDFGVMRFIPVSLLPNGWRELTLPTLSATTRLAPPWKGIATKVLAGEGLSIEQLRVPGLRRPAFGEVPRSVFARVVAFNMTPAEADEFDPKGRRGKRTLRFTLSRGSYATVLLRALGE